MCLCVHVYACMCVILYVCNIFDEKLSKTAEPIYAVITFILYAKCRRHNTMNPIKVREKEKIKVRYRPLVIK